MMSDQEPPDFHLGRYPIRDIVDGKSPEGRPSAIRERLDRTLEHHNYRLVTEIGEYPYPTLEQWIEYYRTRHRSSPRNYQTFLLTDDGRYVFGKIKITGEHLGFGTAFGGLSMEARVLDQLPKEVPAPRLIQYVPSDEATGELELLVTEAVHFSEGTTLPLEMWNSQIANQAAIRIKQIENIPIDQMQDMPQKPIIPVEELIARSKGALNTEFIYEVTKAIEAYKPYSTSVLVHGDTWIKNIVVKNPYGSNPDIMLVDWERGGAGYKGQDAGRTLWELWDNEKTRSFASNYCSVDTDSEKNERKILLTFGTKFEALRWIADRNDAIQIEQDKERISQLKQEIVAIQQKAQEITQFINTL